MIQSAMAMVHLKGGNVICQCQQLMAKADTKEGLLIADNFFYSFNGITHGGRIAGTIGNKITIGIPFPHFPVGGFSRKNFHLHATLNHAIQYIFLDAQVQCRYFDACSCVAGFIRCCSADDGRQFQSGHGWNGRQLNFQLFRVSGFSGNDSIHRATTANMTYQRTRINAFNRHFILLHKILADAAFRHSS